MHGLAKHEVNPKNASILLQKVAQIIEVDDPLISGNAPTFYIRARVWINVSKPIWSGCWLQRSEKERVWICFKYERLQGICYGCGMFGHEKKNCSEPAVMAAYDKKTPKYGPFLTATKPRFFHKLPFGDDHKERNQPDTFEVNTANYPNHASDVQPEYHSSANNGIPVCESQATPDTEDEFHSSANNGFPVCESQATPDDRVLLYGPQLVQTEVKLTEPILPSTIPRVIRKFVGGSPNQPPIHSTPLIMWNFLLRRMKLLRTVELTFLHK